MNGFAPLRPAQGPRAGVPAGFQQSQASEAVEPDEQRSSSSEDGQNKYHLKNPRRLQGDPFPGESSDDTQLQNVERIYHWTLRGAATSAQKKVWWGDVRMNVDEAHADMLKIYPGSCAHLNQACCPSDKVCRQKPEPPRSQASVSPVRMPRPAPQRPESHPTQQLESQQPSVTAPQVPIPAQQGPYSAGHSTLYFQDPFLGAQPPYPKYQETYRSSPQAPVGMHQHADFLLGQGWDDQNSLLQDQPASTPVSQSAFTTGHSAEGLPPAPQQYKVTLWTHGLAPQEVNALAYALEDVWTAAAQGDAAFFSHGSFSSSSLGSSPENSFLWNDDMTASSSSLGTNLTWPDVSEGLQDVPPMSGAEMFDVGAQSHIGAVENLPAEDYSAFFAFGRCRFE
jgi:hypothetical protein